MGEILFRGKHYKTGKWLYGSLLQPINSKSMRINGTNHYCEVDPETVGQFTGITDKNGVKIFEGDIAIECRQGQTTTKPICGVVCWDNELSRLVLKTSNEVRAFINPNWFGKISYEVIGNKWDNPELYEEIK